MELSERLERIGRTKDISEIAEHVRWIEAEGLPEEKKPILDKEVEQAVWRAVQRDVNALHTYGLINPDLAVQQHGRQLRYYRSFERTLERMIGEKSVALKAVRAARSTYAGEILGVAVSRAADLSSTSIARVRRAAEIVQEYNPNIYGSHAVVKIVALNQPRRTITPVIATGLEAKIYGIGRKGMQIVDREGEPRIVRVLGESDRLVKRRFAELVNAVGGLDAEGTSREAINAGEQIRRESNVISAVLDPKQVLSWRQKALNELYRKLIAEAKKASELGNVRGALALKHAAEKVAGWNVVR